MTPKLDIAIYLKVMSKTFRVLKEKEIRQFGEYRSRRLVLEAWEKMNKQ